MYGVHCGSNIRKTALEFSLLVCWVFQNMSHGYNNNQYLSQIPSYTFFQKHSLVKKHAKISEDQTPNNQSYLLFQKYHLIYDLNRIF